MSKSNLNVAWRDINSIRPYEGSARKHNRKAKRKLRTLIEKFGQTMPIAIDADGVIVDGHLVYEVFLELGRTEILTITVNLLDPNDVRALRLALNRMGEDATWDQPQLRQEFSELLRFGYDLTYTAFEPAEIELTFEMDFDALSDGKDVEDPMGLVEPERQISRVGDVWLLGNHRLLCGNATSLEAVSLLFQAEQARMMFADPPYNVPVSGHVSGLGKTRHREFVEASGELTDKEFAKFLSCYYSVAHEFLMDGAIAFSCCDWRCVKTMISSGEDVGFQLKNLIVWKKSNAGMGSFYRSQHELIPVLKKGTAPHVNTFELGQHGRHRTNVWEFSGMNSFGKERSELAHAHPTVKPVDLVIDAIKDVSKRGEIVYDPFSGSGTVLIAAERTGRRCLAVELDPLYVDLGIRRWQTETGGIATHEASGLKFEEIARSIEKSGPLMLPAPHHFDGEDQ